MKLTRDIYRPTADSGFILYLPGNVELPAGVEIYINNERNSVKFFSGRRSKPDFFIDINLLRPCLIKLMKI